MTQLTISNDSLFFHVSVYIVRAKEMCLFTLLSLIKITNQDMHWHNLWVCIHVLLVENQGPPCSAISLWYSGQQGLLSKDMVEGEQGLQDIPAVQEINHRRRKEKFILYSKVSCHICNAPIIFNQKAHHSLVLKKYITILTPYKFLIF